MGSEGSFQACRGECGHFAKEDWRHCRFCGIQFPVFPAAVRGRRRRLFLGIVGGFGLLGYKDGGLREALMTAVFGGVVAYMLLLRFWDYWDAKVRSSRGALLRLAEEIRLPLGALDRRIRQAEDSLSGGLSEEAKRGLEDMLARLSSLARRYSGLRWSIDAAALHNRLQGLGSAPGGDESFLGRKLRELSDIEGKLREAETRWVREDPDAPRSEEQRAAMSELPALARKAAAVRDRLARLQAGETPPPIPETGGPSLDFRDRWETLESERAALPA